MAISYKISDKTLKQFWLILSKDNFICSDNINIILKIAQEYGIDPQSVSIFSGAKPDFSEIKDLAQTVSFFGDRVIVLKDFDILEISDSDLEEICTVIEHSENTHFVLAATYQDDKKLSAKKYDKIKALAQQNGLYHLVKDIDEKYLVDVITSHAKSLDTVLPKEIAKVIVQNVGKNVGLLLKEIEKYSASCDYTEIEIATVEQLGAKTLEASVFDIIDLICAKKAVKAIETLNKLFYLGTDEIAIVGALATGFVDMHRCKLAQSKGLGYQKVHTDFEKTSNVYRYQKAMSNSAKFSLNALEEILKLLLETDMLLKSTSNDKKQLINVMVAQIIAKGIG